MGGLINPKENLPIGVSESQMVESIFKSEIRELRRLLAILVNNKSSSPEYKEAKKQSIDLLSQKPVEHRVWSNFWVKPENRERYEEMYQDFPEDRFDDFDCSLKKYFKNTK